MTDNLINIMQICYRPDMIFQKKHLCFISEFKVAINFKPIDKPYGIQVGTCVEKQNDIIRTSPNPAGKLAQNVAQVPGTMWFSLAI